MNGYELKQKVQAGGIVYGTMLSTSRNPRWASAMSDFGLDYVIIDTEHSPRDRTDIADFLAAFNSTGVVPIQRIPIPDPHYVTMALDGGGPGCAGPLLRDCRGGQGSGGRQPSGGHSRVRWPARSWRLANCPPRPRESTWNERNRNLTMGRVLQPAASFGIESVSHHAGSTALDNLDNIYWIAYVPGIDGYLRWEPNDLSISLDGDSVIFASAMNLHTRWPSERSNAYTAPDSAAT